MPGPVGPDLVPPPSEKNIRVAAYLHVAGFGAANELATAWAIAKAESGLNYTAQHRNSNGTTDFGLMQINSIHHPTDAEKTQPLANAKKAFQIYAQAGRSFSPWSTYKSGAYRAHLTEANAAVRALKAKGPQWERETVKDESFDRPVSAGNIPVPDNPLATLASLPGTIAHVASNITAIILAIVLLALGVFLISRTSITNAATKVAGKIIKA